MAVALLGFSEASASTLPSVAALQGLAPGTGFLFLHWFTCWGPVIELSFSKELESLVCVVLDVSVVDQTLNEPKISSGYCEVSQWCARSEYSVAELLADILVLLNNHFEVSCESALYMSSFLWGHCREFFWINRNPAFSFTKPLMD